LTQLNETVKGLGFCETFEGLFASRLAPTLIEATTKFMVTTETCGSELAREGVIAKA
jgi:hypothetical protein